MADRLKIVFFVFMLFLISSCSSTKQLKKNYYATDFIIRENGSIAIEEDIIPLKDLHREMILRMIENKSHIYIHVHEKAPAAVFDEVYKLLRAKNYTNLSFETFNTEL